MNFEPNAELAGQLEVAEQLNMITVAGARQMIELAYAQGKAEAHAEHKMTEMAIERIYAKRITTTAMTAIIEAMHQNGIHQLVIDSDQIGEKTPPYNIRSEGSKVFYTVEQPKFDHEAARREHGAIAAFRVTPGITRERMQENYNLLRDTYGVGDGKVVTSDYYKRQNDAMRECLPIIAAAIKAMPNG